MSIQIIENKHWESAEYIVIALLDQRIYDLREFAKIEFTADEDSLGAFDYCFLVGELNGYVDQIILRQHLLSPEQRTEVWVFNRDSFIKERLLVYFAELSPIISISQWCNEDLLI